MEARSKRTDKYASKLAVSAGQEETGLDWSVNSRARQGTEEGAVVMKGSVTSVTLALPQGKEDTHANLRSLIAGMQPVPLPR